MKISEEALQKIIKDEINEIFGFGKKKKKKQVKEYPASELTVVIKALDDASRMSGAKLTPEQREAIVDELTDLLEDEGFVIKENEGLFTGGGDITVTRQKAPKLNVFLNTVAERNPRVFKQLSGLLKRSALDTSPMIKAVTPAPASPSPSPGSTATKGLEKTIQTISRKDNGRLRAFLSIVNAAYPNTPLASRVAIAFDKTKDASILRNLPKGDSLPKDIAQLIASVAQDDQARKGLQTQVQTLLKKYKQNPQLIVSKSSEPETSPGDSAPASGLKNLKPGEVMVALNQLGLRQGTIERAAKKALANRGLTKADRENIEAVTKQLISYLEGGLKESKIIVGPAAMRMIEELYENRWKEIAGIK